MPLFKSKKKTQAAEQDARNAHEHHENRNTAGSTAGANPNVNDYANQPGPPGQVHTINRRGGGPARAADNGKVGSPAYGNTASTDPSLTTERHHDRGKTRVRAEGGTEEVAGQLVGSRALQAHGAQKEQEANAIKVQSTELAEAERLEREAVLRRETAVAHGAHPDNKHLGAGFSNSTGASN